MLATIPKSANAALPDALESTLKSHQWLADHIRNHPDQLFDAGFLDKFADGRNDEEDAGILVGSTYAEDLLPAIAWWAHLQADLFVFISIERAQPALKAMNEFMAVLAAGLTACSFEDTDPDERALAEMLRRYRIWTRIVAKMAKGRWPGIDLSRLA